MRVGFFSDGFNINSGFGKVSRYLIRGLVFKGFEVSQFHLQFFGEPTLVQNGAVLFNVYQGGDQNIQYFPRYLREEKPDVVVFLRSLWDLRNNTWPTFGLLQALKDAKTKFILYSPLEHAKPDLTWLVALWKNYGANVFAALAAPSEWSASQFAKVPNKPWEIVYCIRHGVDTNIFTPGPRTTEEGKKVLFDFEEDRFVYGMVGFNHPRKDFPALIESYRYLTRYHPFSSLGIQDKLGLWLHTNPVTVHRSLFPLLEDNDKNIRFPYPPIDERWGVSENRLAATYRALDAYVHIVRAGGFELPLLEALACGTPVIASNNSCVPEVVGDAATLIEPWKAQDTDKGTWWLTDPIRIADEVQNKSIIKHLETSHKVQKRVEQAAKFPWSRSVNDFVKMLEDLKI